MKALALLLCSVSLPVFAQARRSRIRCAQAGRRRRGRPHPPGRHARQPAVHGAGQKGPLRHRSGQETILRWSRTRSRKTFSNSRRKQSAAAPGHPDRHQQQHPGPLQVSSRKRPPTSSKPWCVRAQDKAMVVSFDTTAELVADLTDDHREAGQGRSAACGRAAAPRSTTRFFRLQGQADAGPAAR